MRFNKFFCFFLLFCFSIIVVKGQYTVTNTFIGTFPTISSSGTVVTTWNVESPSRDVDENNVEAPIGFSFNYHGTAYSYVNINTNGWIGLTTQSADWSSVLNNGDFYSNQLNSTMLYDIIAPLKGDQYIPSADVYYKTEGTPGSRIFTVEWNHVDGLGGAQGMSYQVKLHENGTIDFIYGDAPVSFPTGNAGIGLIFKDGTIFGSTNIFSSDFSASGTSVNVSEWPNFSEFTLTPSIAPSPSLAITAPAASLTACSGNASAATNFNISGSNLTESVTISAPTDFEISTNATDAFAASLTLTNTSTVSKTIYIRLNATATDGSKTGSISATSTGVVDEPTTTINGIVNAIPTVSITESDASGTANNDNMVCNAGSATLTASGATTYLWSTYETVVSINPSTATTTIYTVTGTTSGCSNTASITIIAEVVTAPTLSINSTISLCSEATYLITKTTAALGDGVWSVSGSNTVANGYLTASTTPGTYTVSYTDGCAQMVNATVVVDNTSSVPAITDGLASYKFDGTPKGPSSASYFIGYNGFNYSSPDKPTKTGFYKANIQVGDSAGCPFTFNIFRCTSCPN